VDAGMVKFPNRKVYYGGDLIFKEGDHGDCAYLIERGAVRISKRTRDGDIELGILRGGAIFGEMALIDDSPRMASAVATEETVLTFVNHAMFEKKMEGIDPFIKALIHILVRYVRSMGDKVRRLSDEKLDQSF
jgi:CRP/FNR family transcriptional regulator, cyclic AMP receptor protein